MSERGRTTEVRREAETAAASLFHNRSLEDVIHDVLLRMKELTEEHSDAEGTGQRPTAAPTSDAGR